MSAHVILYLLGALVMAWSFTLILRGVWRRGARIGPSLPGDRQHATAPRSHAVRSAQLPDVLAGIAGAFTGLGILGVGAWVRSWLDTWRSQSDLVWLWYVAMTVTASVGLATIVAGVFFDPSRGRLRCPRCWYDMAGAPGLTCPECGKIAATNHGLQRTRPHRPVVALGVVVVACAALVQRAPFVGAYGWSGLMPTTLVIAVFEWMPERLALPRRRSNELDERMRNSWPWQRDWLNWRCQRLANSADSFETLVLADMAGDVDWGQCNASRLGIALGAVLDRACPRPEWARYLVTYMAARRDAATAVMTRRDQLGAALADFTLDPNQRIAAAIALTSVGECADPFLAPVLAELGAARASPSVLRPEAAAVALTELAKTSDIALDALHEQLALGPDDFRSWLGSYAALGVNSARTRLAFLAYIEGMNCETACRIVEMCPTEELEAAQMVRLLERCPAAHYSILVAHPSMLRGEAAFVPVFQRELQHPALRRDAIGALARIGGAAFDAVPALVRLLGSPGLTGREREEASRALIVIYNAAVEPRTSDDETSGKE